jgi:hypothetical protein
MPMSQVSLADELNQAVSKLQKERKEHEAAIQEIDSVFERLGITPPARKRRGRPPGRKTGARKPARAAKPARGRRKRRTFKVSGLQSVLGFVKAARVNGRTTGEIIQHWKSEGRSGDGYTTIGELVKAGSLKKEEMKGERGSRYTAG